MPEEAGLDEAELDEDGAGALLSLAADLDSDLVSDLVSLDPEASDDPAPSPDLAAPLPA